MQLQATGTVLVGGVRQGIFDDCMNQRACRVDGQKGCFAVAGPLENLDLLPRLLRSARNGTYASLVGLAGPQVGLDALF
jgi:hypothetical protein